MTREARETSKVLWSRCVLSLCTHPTTSLCGIATAYSSTHVMLDTAPVCIACVQRVCTYVCKYVRMYGMYVGYSAKEDVCVEEQGYQGSERLMI